MKLSETKYIIVQFPESQELMCKRDFDKHSYLISDEDGIEDFGNSAFFVEEKWYNKVTK